MQYWISSTEVAYKTAKSFIRDSHHWKLTSLKSRVTCPKHNSWLQWRQQALGICACNKRQLKESLCNQSLETQKYLSGACQWSFFLKGLVLPAEKHTGVILMGVCHGHLLGGRIWGSSIGNQASPVLGSIQGIIKRWLQWGSLKTARTSHSPEPWLLCFGKWHRETKVEAFGILTATGLSLLLALQVDRPKSVCVDTSPCVHTFTMRFCLLI